MARTRKTYGDSMREHEARVDELTWKRVMKTTLIVVGREDDIPELIQEAIDNGYDLDEFKSHPKVAPLLKNR